MHAAAALPPLQDHVHPRVHCCEEQHAAVLHVLCTQHFSGEELCRNSLAGLMCDWLLQASWMRTAPSGTMWCRCLCAAKAAPCPAASATSPPGLHSTMQVYILPWFELSSQLLVVGKGNICFLAWLSTYRRQGKVRGAGRRGLGDEFGGLLGVAAA